MITLKKEDGPADLTGVTNLSVGVSWDPTQGAAGGLIGWANRKRGTDLDLVAILCQDGDPVRLAGLDSLDPVGNGSVVHSGDNQTGHGVGDDETVTIDFGRVPGNIDSILFVAAAYKKGSDFSKARNISFKVYDGTGGTTEQVADIWPSMLNTGNAVGVAKAFRNGNAWQIVVVNHMGKIKQGNETALLRFATGL